MRGRSFHRVRGGLRVTLPLVLALAGLSLSLVIAGCGEGSGTAATTPVSDATVTTGEGSSPSASVEVTTTLPETTTTQATGTTVATAPAQTTTTEPLASSEKRLANGNIRAIGYIEKVWEAGGQRHISIDYVDFLGGKEAQEAAVAAGVVEPGEPVPNDYFIRNENSRLREFTVSPSAVFSTWTLGDDVVEQPVTWALFTRFWGPTPPSGTEGLADVPWWIERKGGEVVSIEEQYLP